jgi:hypothetical protein
MWKRLCHAVIHRREQENQEVSAYHGIHYNSELYKYYLFTLEKNKAFHYSCLEKNIFIPERQKQMIFHMYVEMTTLHRRLRRCILTYWESKQPSCNLSDLSFTPFKEYAPHQYFSLFDGRKKYVFTHTEMYSIIESSLTNADSHLIANPLSIKNPYTGTLFSKPLLYHIYFSLKHLPLFFIHFMRIQFDLTVFLLEQESNLRQYNIHKKVRNLTGHELKNEMKYMIVDIYSFIVDDVNPDVILIDCDQRFSRELLTHYYNYAYSLNPYQRLCECKTLVDKIKNMSNHIHKNIIT